MLDVGTTKTRAPIKVNDFVVPLLNTIMNDHDHGCLVSSAHIAILVWNTIMIITMAAYIANNLHEVSFVAKPIVVSPEKSNLDNFFYGWK